LPSTGAAGRAKRRIERARRTYRRAAAQALGTAVRIFRGFDSGRLHFIAGECPSVLVMPVRYVPRRQQKAASFDP